MFLYGSGSKAAQEQQFHPNSPKMQRQAFVTRAESCQPPSPLKAEKHLSIMAAHEMTGHTCVT